MVPDCAVQPAVRAGSAIIFTEALVRGTRPWHAQHDRYVLFYKYLPGRMVFGVNQLKKGTQLDGRAEALRATSHALGIAGDLSC